MLEPKEPMESNMDLVNLPKSFKFLPRPGYLVVAKTDKKRSTNNMSYHLCEVVEMNAESSYQGINCGDYVEVNLNRMIPIYDYKENNHGLSGLFTVDINEVNGIYVGDQDIDSAIQEVINSRTNKKTEEEAS